MLPYIGDKTGKRILSHVKAEEVIEEKGRCLKNIPEIQSRLVVKVREAISNGLKEKAEREIELMERNEVNMTFFGDEDYPSRLVHQEDSPNCIFYKGELPLNPYRTVAIVGTRKASDYGARIIHRFLEDLKGAGITMISGLAYGIDTIAHRESLNMGYTNIGVLAHGMHMVYPSINQGLAQQIQQHGCIMSEFRFGVKPDRENFPKRNRIVAGLADAVVVVESAEKGGALITADLANGYNKDVFAFPADIYKKYSVGCNQLIRDNKAALITSAEDFLKLMNWDVKKEERQTSLFVELNKEEQAVVNLLRAEQTASFNYILAKEDLKPGQLSGILLELEFKGVVTPLPGNAYRIT